MARKAIIIGAGMSGLAAAWRLAQRGFSVRVVEKEDHVGGQAWTFRHGDFLLDLGPHKLFTGLGHVMQVIRDLLGDDLLEREKKGRVMMHGKYIGFPVGPKEMLAVLTPWQSMRCMVSFAGSMMRSLLARGPAADYEAWLIGHFGRAAYELVIKPCTEKIWGESRTLSAELAETRIRVRRPFEMLREILFGIRPGRMVNTHTFLYPKYGSGMIPDRMRSRIETLGGVVRCGVQPVGIETERGRVRILRWSDGTQDELGPDDVVVSTMPIAALTNIMDAAPDTAVRDAVAALRERSLILLYLVVNRPRVTNDNWILFPGPEYVFNRLFEQKNYSPFTCPADRTVLCVEITCNVGDTLWRTSHDDLFDQVTAGLASAGLVERREIGEHFEVRLPHAYPIWDVPYKQNLASAMSYLDQYVNLYSIGRQGGFVYSSAPECMDMGFVTGDYIAAGRPREAWPAERDAFSKYVVVD